MQTFLPITIRKDFAAMDFAKNASVLDVKRLGKQRLESKQMLQINLGLKDNNWKHHPCTKMWRGYEKTLAQYGFYICNEWIKRGYVDNQLFFFSDILWDNSISEAFPYFLGSKMFHDSHKSLLLRKSPEWYQQFNWNVPADLPAFWPLQGIYNV